MNDVLPRTSLARTDPAFPMAPPAVSSLPQAAPGRLTNRQFDVLALLCEGLPNKGIARQLGIACPTVKVHMSAILRTLEARNRTEAVLRARERGLILPAARGNGLEVRPRVAP